LRERKGQISAPKEEAGAVPCPEKKRTNMFASDFPSGRKGQLRGRSPRNSEKRQEYLKKNIRMPFVRRHEGGSNSQKKIFINGGRGGTGSVRGLQSLRERIKKKYKETENETSSF